MYHPGIRAAVIRQPWLDSFEIIMGGGGPNSYRAVGIGDDGRIIYETHGEGAQAEPFLRLDRNELEALARAILEEERPEDATVAALKDARSTRDRLLAMLEKRGIR